MYSQVVDGYFTHFFAPVGLTPLRKRILFVLDVSGSMSFSGKVAQLKVCTDSTHTRSTRIYTEFDFGFDDS